MSYLSKKSLDQYHRDGYLFPLSIFDKQKAAEIRRTYDATKLEAQQAGLDHHGARYFRTNAQLTMPFVSEVARTPRLLDMVESILGPDLLLWSAEFFVKEANSPKIVSWHQDLTYWGLGETDEEITAWVALSDVTVESGCMQFVAGSHKLAIQPHRDTFEENNLLSRGQELAVDVDPTEAVNIKLKLGQTSFHHGRMFHASGPNSTNAPRIGLAIRYITPSVKQLVGQRDYAMQVRGIDSGQNWIHVAPPSYNFQPQYMELHQQVRVAQLEALSEGAAETLVTER